jgi:glycosyltransferase involved in cell wall biosynthesis
MAQANESLNEPADEPVETPLSETHPSPVSSTPAANADGLHEFGKTHVLYLNHVGQMSGAEQSLRALLWQFRRDRNEVDPVVALPGGGPFSELLRDEGWNVTFAPLRRLHRPQGFLDGMTALVHILQTAPFITRLARQTGTQIIHSNSTTAHLVGGLAAERLQIPSIWHARDLVSLARIASHLSQRTTKCIAISNCVAERLKADGVPEEKIRVIYNGLDPDEWRPRDTNASHLRETLGVDENTFLFGCASQLVPWKNHKAFIEAAARLAQDEKCSNARFVIIGGDLWGEQQEYVKELRALVKQHELQERFNFVPHQNDNGDALAALNAVVLPSREEPFGRVLLEAMALQKVAIAFHANGPREIITHEKDGLLVPLAQKPEDEEGEEWSEEKIAESEADALAHAMKRALLSESLRDEIGQAARNSVVQKFHIADSAQAVRELYREVLL